MLSSMESCLRSWLGLSLTPAVGIIIRRLISLCSLFFPVPGPVDTLDQPVTVSHSRIFRLALSNEVPMFIALPRTEFCPYSLAPRARVSDGFRLRSGVPLVSSTCHPSPLCRLFFLPLPLEVRGRVRADRLHVASLAFQEVYQFFKLSRTRCRCPPTAPSLHLLTVRSVVTGPTPLLSGRPASPMGRSPLYLDRPLWSTLLHGCFLCNAHPVTSPLVAWRGAKPSYVSQVFTFLSF